jgi:hypothetical protein
MNSAASSSMTSFTSFLSQEGQLISDQLGSHFKSVSNHLDEQQNDINSINSNANIHADNINATVLKPTGGTPRKLQEKKKWPLRATRSHSTIKTEVKQGLKPTKTPTRTSIARTASRTIVEEICPMQGVENISPNINRSVSIDLDCCQVPNPNVNIKRTRSKQGSDDAWMSIGTRSRSKDASVSNDF